MKVSTEELREFLEVILKRLEDRGKQEIHIEADFYWHVPQEAWNDPYVEPKDLTLGQLSDDIAELRRITSGASDPLVYAAVWLGAILRAVGESQPP